ncbi:MULTISPECIES: hypothetical protein [Clostridium]|uniref:Twitching motility protein PilT n=1 Tax=Clostridium cibarium TaxID=2762247 RepID=A0ABR8PPX9_9CLOT|nr:MULTISPECIES: hypothetical protein [Clostridium]MBD7910235.1 hypothetical protein [Clostridium cibarium]
MIQVFCNKRGSGKTKNLINLANEQLTEAKGDSVYIDDDNRHISQINRRIRFINTNEFNITGYNEFYGLLCGIISENYDVENIYIDGVFKINSGTTKESSEWFKRIYKLTKQFEINIYMNINYENQEIPDFIKEYVA